MYKKLIKPLLFQLPPEASHRLFHSFSKILFSIPITDFVFETLFSITDNRLSVRLAGIDFRNPVGLAAGFDKNAALFDELSYFGFGFIEVGTVTPKPQPGNPLPRLFRLPQDLALVNRMGFNNDGVHAVAKRLEKRKTAIVIGANIGKNKSTPIENAAPDYLTCFNTLFDLSDYFVLNISSPNTPGLRELQQTDNLKKLLGTVVGENLKHRQPKPVFLKISPDLSDEELAAIVSVATVSGVTGIVAANTTTNRQGLKTPDDKLTAIGEGGISGKPVEKVSCDQISRIRTLSGGKILIIGVGGIFSPEDAIRKLNAGASLIQLYTGFIYEGPGLVMRINNAILAEK